MWLARCVATYTQCVCGTHTHTYTSEKTHTHRESHICNVYVATFAMCMWPHLQCVCGHICNVYVAFTMCMCLFSMCTRCVCVVHNVYVSFAMYVSVAMVCASRQTHLHIATFAEAASISQQERPVLSSHTYTSQQTHIHVHIYTSRQTHIHVAMCIHIATDALTS